MKLAHPRFIARTFLLGIAMTLLATALLHIMLARSLPFTSGEHEVAGLEAPVTIERDALGIARIKAQTLDDAFFAQGYVHAQERHLQMDLARRYISGELSELLGRASLPTDRVQRRYGFSRVASEMLAAMPPEHLGYLRAYTLGVNAGLADLPMPHPVYTVLRQSPREWSVEDCVLVAISMHATLAFGEPTERMVNVMNDALPPELVDFLTPHTTTQDAPLVDEAPPALPPIPGAVTRGAQSMPEFLLKEPLEFGSNNWVVGAAKTADGRAIVANDMHLGLMVPNTWHRCELQTAEVKLIGVSLPGVPGIVVGSNTKIAWGFTNVMGDFQDLVRLTINPADERDYRTPDGNETFDAREEIIQVRGEDPVVETVRTTRWGPVVDPLHDGTPVALAWPVLDARTNNLDIFGLYHSNSIDEALTVIDGWYGPPQNVTIADAQGNIAWTISGYLPKREGFSGKHSVDWSSAGVGWATGEQTARPVMRNPEAGSLATANARTLPAREAELIGHNWGHPVRQARIQELLASRDSFDEDDLLGIQLDTDVSATFGPYRDAFLAIRDDALAPAQDAVRQWNGRADINEVGMPIVAGFKRRVSSRLIFHLVEPCEEIDDSFWYSWFQSDDVVRRLLEHRPEHILPDGYENWDAFLRQAAIDTVEGLTRSQSEPLPTWGDRHRAGIRHVLSMAVPSLGVVLDAPSDPLPGHYRAVRAQGPSFGASQRLVVSPGREEDGILHMPTGQVMHPLSAHRMDMHDDWVRGEPTPLLAGEAVETMTLVPSGSH